MIIYHIYVKICSCSSKQKLLGTKWHQWGICHILALVCESYATCHLLPEPTKIHGQQTYSRKPKPLHTYIPLKYWQFVDQDISIFNNWKVAVLNAWQQNHSPAKCFANYLYLFGDFLNFQKTCLKSNSCGAAWWTYQFLVYPREVRV